MELALEVSVVNDSQDDDSDYDFGHDLARFHRRRPILEKELAKQQARHNMMATTTTTTTTTTTSSFSDTGPAPQMHQIDVESIASASDSSLTDLEEDDDDDGLPGFNIGRTNTTLGLRHATPSKYSMQDILKLARKNKSNEAVIERAQRLYDENAEEKLPEAPLTRMENLVPYLDPQNRNDTFVKSWMDRNATPDYDWSFFEQEIPPLRVTRPHFSKHYANPLLSQLQDSSMCRQLFISGCIADSLKLGLFDLPSSLEDWLLSEVCFESAQDLSTAYGNAIAAYRTRIGLSLDEDKISQMFKLLGASQLALARDKPISKIKIGATDATIPRKWWNISLFLKLLAKIMPTLDDRTVRATWDIVVRLCLDMQVLKRRKLLVDIFNLMELVLRRVEEFPTNLVDKLLSDLKATLQDTTLQIRLLRCVPVSTAFAHNFRRQAAAIFLLPGFLEPRLRRPLGIASMMPAIHQKLESRDVRIKKGESYAQVQEIVDTINILVDDCQLRDLNLRQHQSGSQTQLQQLILRLEQARETIPETNDLNVDKSNAKDAFMKLISRLRTFLPSEISQTMMDRYFRPPS